MSSENRTPAGVPTGGQFAASAKPESGVSLHARHEVNEERRKALHDAAESFAANINSAGRDEQVAFLRRMGVDKYEIGLAVDHWNSDVYVQGLVLHACSDVSARAYYGAGTPDEVTETLERAQARTLEG